MVGDNIVAGKIKKGLGLCVIMLSAVCANLTVLEAEMKSVERDDVSTAIEQAVEPVEGEVVRIDIPTEGGEFITLEGEEAKKWYMEATQETVKALIEDESIQNYMENVNDNSNRIMPYGAFKYQYRYVESKRTNNVKRTDLKRNVTNELTNYTSTTQSYQLTLNVSQSWTINSEVTGKYKDAVTTALGGEWGKSYSKSESLHINIEPGKIVQVQFVPIMDKSVGVSQKYYIPRGGMSSKPIIEKSVSVTTYNPKYTTCKIGPFTMKSVYGAYIWIEK